MPLKPESLIYIYFLKQCLIQTYFHSMHSEFLSLLQWDQNQALRCKEAPCSQSPRSCIDNPFEWGNSPQPERIRELGKATIAAMCHLGVRLQGGGTVLCGIWNFSVAEMSPCSQRASLVPASSLAPGWPQFQMSVKKA